MNSKIKSLLFVPLLLVSLIVCSSVSPCYGQTAINNPFGIAFKPDPPFDIDGDLSEWNQVPNAQELTSVEHVIYGKDMWESCDDLSAKVWLAWRDAHLYLAVDVKDDKLRQTQTNRDMWKGDHIE
ncbi:MAG: sugar-binding protein, partial [Planctomycetota bacterium]